MTGDGAVVDPLQWRFDRRGGAGVWSGDDPLGAFQIVERHNAVVAHSRQQAAEIERLTNKAAMLEKSRDIWSELADLRLTEKKASEARAADLLKALEEYGKHHGICPHSADPFTSQECRCGLVETLAAAKGETV